LFNACDSVTKLPLPVIPGYVGDASEKPVPVGGGFTWGFFLQVAGEARSTGGLLFSLIPVAGLKATTVSTAHIWVSLFPPSFRFFA